MLLFIFINKFEQKKDWQEIISQVSLNLIVSIKAVLFCILFYYLQKKEKIFYTHKNQMISTIATIILIGGDKIDKGKRN